MRDPLHTKLCDTLGIEFPIIAFTHCKDVAAAVINAGAFAVYGGTPHAPDKLAAEIKWIRDRVGGKPFGVDLVLPASASPSATLEELKAQIPEAHRKFAEGIKKRYQIPDPKNEVEHYQLGWLNQERARRQLDVVLEEKPAVLAFGLGSPNFIIEAAHARGIQVWGLVGKPRQAARELEAGVDAIIAQGTDAAGHTGAIGTFSIVPAVVAIAGETPVIAAGGVTTGRHLAAALCLGRSRSLDGNALVGLPGIRCGHHHQGEAARRQRGGHRLLPFRLGVHHAHDQDASGPPNGSRPTRRTLCRRRTSSCWAPRSTRQPRTTRSSRS